MPPNQVIPRRILSYPRGGRVIPLDILSYPRRCFPPMLSAEAPTRLRKHTLPLRCLADIGARRAGPFDLRRRLALARGEAQVSRAANAPWPDWLPLARVARSLGTIWQQSMPPLSRSRCVLLSSKAHRYSCRAHITLRRCEHALCARSKARSGSPPSRLRARRLLNETAAITFAGYQANAS